VVRTSVLIRVNTERQKIRKKSVGLGSTHFFYPELEIGEAKKTVPQTRKKGTILLSEGSEALSEKKKSWEETGSSWLGVQVRQDMFQFHEQSKPNQGKEPTKVTPADSNYGTEIVLKLIKVLLGKGWSPASGSKGAAQKTALTGPLLLLHIERPL